MRIENFATKIAFIIYFLLQVYLQKLIVYKHWFAQYIHAVWSWYLQMKKTLSTYQVLTIIKFTKVSSVGNSRTAKITVLETEMRTMKKIKFVYTCSSISIAVEK